MRNLPRDTRSQSSGRRASARAASWLEDNNLIWREGSQETDFGIDGEMEIRTDDGVVTARIVKCQIKGAQSVRFSKSGNFKVTVKPTTLNYWATLPLNVVCLLVDLSTNNIYWALPNISQAGNTQTLTFSQSRCASSKAKVFREQIIDLADMPANYEVLRKISEDLKLICSVVRQEHVESYFGLSSLSDHILRVSYDRLTRLCIFLNLDDYPVKISQWSSRSQLVERIHNHEYGGRFGVDVAGEMWSYMTIYYKQALIKIGRIFRTEEIAQFDPALAEYAAMDKLNERGMDELFNDLNEHGYWPNSDGCEVLVPPNKSSVMGAMSFDKYLESLNCSKVHIERHCAELLCDLE